MTTFALSRRSTDLSLSTGVALVAVFGLAPLLGWAAANEYWRVFGVLVGVAAMPIIIRWPVLSTFGVYALVLPFENVSMVGGTTLARYAGMLAAGVLLLVGLNQGRLVRPPSVALWWGALVLWAGWTTAWAIDADVAALKLRTAISLFLLFLIAVSFQVSQKELYGICVLIVVGGVAAAVAGYAFGADDFETGRRGTLVIGAAQANPNGFASSLLTPVALALGAFLKVRGPLVRAAALAAVAILAAGIYISISRSALLAFAVLIGILVYRIGVRSHAIVAMLMLVGMLSAMPERFFRRVLSPFTGLDDTGSGRTEIWSMGLRALEEFWIWGAGISNFPSVYARYTPVPPGDIAMGAHNLYLGTWVELGIVGLAILLVAISGQFLLAWRARRSGSLVLYAVEACLAGHFLLAFFGDPLWGKRQWMLCILLVWAARLATESAEQVSTRWIQGRATESSVTALRSAGPSISRRL